MPPEIATKPPGIFGVEKYQGDTLDSGAVSV